MFSKMSLKCFKIFANLYKYYHCNFPQMFPGLSQKPPANFMVFLLMCEYSKAGFKRLRFPIMANCSATGIPLAYINNFIQIWCGAPFCGMPCGSNSHQMYLEPHGLPFESSSSKYIWIILLRPNTMISAADFIGQTATSGSAQLQRATWSDFISTVCRMVVYGAPPWETAIVWNQPNIIWWLRFFFFR